MENRSWWLLTIIHDCSNHHADTYRKKLLASWIMADASFLTRPRVLILGSTTTNVSTTLTFVVHLRKRKVHGQTAIKCTTGSTWYDTSTVLLSSNTGMAIHNACEVENIWRWLLWCSNTMIMHVAGWVGKGDCAPNLSSHLSNNCKMRGVDE